MSRRPLVAAGVALAVTFLLGCWGGDTFPPLERHRVDYSNHTTFFPIDTGDVHDRPDCQLCHGGTATFADFSCIRCHDHARAHTDSLHVGNPDYSYDSTSCFRCHPDGTAAGVNHVQFFPIGAGTAHSAQKCGDCHPDPRDHAVFTCVSCHTHAQAHTDSTHTGVTGYQYVSPACLSCHPQAEVITRAQHAQFFPIASGRHALACADCHTTPDFSKFECIVCHTHTCDQTDPRHREVRNYSCVSTECYRCHPAGRAGD